jgi:hypothetical protein
MTKNGGGKSLRKDLYPRDPLQGLKSSDLRKSPAHENTLDKYFM